MGKKQKKCYDGYLVKSLDPVVFLMPYIMPRRTDSEVFADLKFDLSKVEEFIRVQRKNGIPDLTLYHFVFAALARAAFEYPQINRFITKNRIYERDHVRVSMVIKKTFELEGKESSIFPVFEKSDTLKDMVEKIQKLADEAMADRHGDSNRFDNLTGILYSIPPFIVRGFIRLMFWMDRHGWLPKSLVNTQPFHSSFFVSNVGSIGLPVIYHHLYEFGTCSGFVTMGRKETVIRLNRDGEPEKKKVLPIKFVADARICDGYSYSCAFRAISKCFDNPEILLKSFHDLQKEKGASV